MSNEPIESVIEPIEPVIKYSQEDFVKIASEKKAIEASRKALEVERDALKAQIQKATDEKLQESGDLRTLLDNKEKELVESKLKESDLEKLKTEKDELVQGIKDDLSIGLSKNQKEFVKDFSVNQLRQYIKLHGVTVEKALEVDSSGNPIKKDAVKLTDKENNEAVIMGVSADDYKLIMEKRKENLKK